MKVSKAPRSEMVIAEVKDVYKWAGIDREYVEDKLNYKGVMHDE